MEEVQQHLQAEQLDGGEGAGRLDAGVETRAKRTGRTAEPRRSCRGNQFTSLVSGGTFSSGIAVKSQGLVSPD